MTYIEYLIPAGWAAHGRHRAPATLVGSAIRRAAGVHYLQTTANPATTAALVAAIAVSASAGAAGARLTPRRGDSTPRAVSGFLGASVATAPLAVAILAANQDAPIGPAIYGAALAAGIARHLDVAWIKTGRPASVADFDAIRRLEREVFTAPLGLIVLVQNFTGDREQDAGPSMISEQFAATFTVPVLIVTPALPAQPNPDAVTFSITDKEFACQNPQSGVPFASAITREEILIDGEPIIVATLGPKRGLPIIVKQAPPPRPNGGPTPRREQAEFVYLLEISNIRLPSLTPAERDLLGDCKHTIDRATALKFAAQSPAGVVIIAVVPAFDRDPGKLHANADDSWLRAEIRRQGLEQKISVEIAPFGINWSAEAV